MNDREFYQRINLLDDVVDVPEPAPARRLPRWRDLSRPAQMTIFTLAYVSLAFGGWYLVGVGMGEPPAALRAWTMLAALVIVVMTALAAGVSLVQDRRR